MARAVDRVLACFPDAKPSGDGWKTRCPAHEDRNPSLSIRQAEDGRVLLHCHAGCSPESIMAAVGLSMRALFPESETPPAARTRRKAAPPKRPSGRTFATRKEAIQAAAEMVKGKAVAGWPYYTADGQELFWAIRFETANGKTFRPIHKSENGWCLGDPIGPLPLYRLPELSGAARVYVCEGEKAADAARSLGLVATTSAHGSQSPERTDWTPLAGRDVVILPDADEAGRGYAQAVARILLKLSPPAKVRIVELPGLPPKGDLMEFTQMRKDKKPETVRAEIESLAEQAKPVALSDLPAHESARPRSMASRVERYQPFPVDVLPEPVSTFVERTATSIGCDPCYVALPLLSGLAAAVGNSRRIKLKEDWTEPSVIWTAIVGESGTSKSPAIDAALRPIHERQSEGFKRHKAAMSQYEIDEEAYQIDLAKWKKVGRKAGRPRPEQPEQPVCERVLCSDITVEALADRLSHAPRGLLVVHDELSGWLGSFDAYKSVKGSDAAHWLTMFGARPLVVDRKTGDKATIHVPRAAVCVAGGIQPEPLRRLLGREHFDNGMAARLLMGMPPRRAKRWSEASVTPGIAADLTGVFDRLFALELQTGEDGEPCPVGVGLTAEGKAAWAAFYDQHGKDATSLSGDLASAWAKLEGYVPRFALVFHLVRAAHEDPGAFDGAGVDAESIGAAVTVCRWFWTEVERIYAALTETEEQGRLRKLIELVEQRGEITPRDLRQSDRFYRHDPDAADADLHALVEAGIGAWHDKPPGPKGGRPTRVFRLVNGTPVNETPSESQDLQQGGGFVDNGCVDGGESVTKGEREQLNEAQEERAAILEYEADLPQDEAERRAKELAQSEERSRI